MTLVWAVQSATLVLVTSFTVSNFALARFSSKAGPLFGPFSFFLLFLASLSFSFLFI